MQDKENELRDLSTVYSRFLPSLGLDLPRPISHEHYIALLLFSHDRMRKKVDVSSIAAHC